MKALVSAVLVAVGSVLAAAPAHADEGKFLALLDDKYAFLSSEQLLAEGARICAALDQGTISPDVVKMVQKDLGGLTVAVALDIVSAAAVGLC